MSLRILKNKLRFSFLDFFVGLFVQPLTAAGLIIQTQDRPELHCFIKMITGVLGVICVGASLGHVGLISIERYLAVRFAFQYRSIMTFRKTLTLIAFLWIFFVLYAILSVVVFPQFGEAVGHSVVVGFILVLTASCYTGVFIKAGLSSATIINSLSFASTAAQQRIMKEKKIAKFMLFTVAVLALFYS